MQLDEETAGVVLRPLDEDPHTPSTIDVRRAVTDGRRRRRTRRIGAYAATAGVTALAVAAGSIVAGQWRSGRPATEQPAAPKSAAVAAPTQCTLNQLPLPDGRTMALVTAGDPTGRYLAGRTYPAHGSKDGTMGLHLVIWDRLKPTQVAMPGDDQTFRDINSSGVAVGSGWGKPGASYYYRDGKVTKLPGGDGAEVSAINEVGAVVGTKADKPVIWRSVDQAPVNLALPDGARTGAASDIDDDGTVIGTVGDHQPYVWAPDGTGHPLTIPSDVPAPPTQKDKMPLASVFNIRNGWVTGRVAATSVRWNLRTGEVHQFPDLAGRANAINGYGWQVGISSEGRALFRSDAGPVSLPELAPHQPGSLTNIPNTISDDGKVIGGQSDGKDDVIRAVVWTCT